MMHVQWIHCKLDVQFVHFGEKRFDIALVESSGVVKKQQSCSGIATNESVHVPLVELVHTSQKHLRARPNVFVNKIQGSVGYELNKIPMIGGPFSVDRAIFELKNGIIRFAHNNEKIIVPGRAHFEI